MIGANIARKSGKLEKPKTVLKATIAQNVRAGYTIPQATSKIS